MCNHIKKVEFSFANTILVIKANERILDYGRFLLSCASPLPSLKNAIFPTHPYSRISQNEVYKSWCTQRRPTLLYLNGESNTQLASEYILYDLDNIRPDKIIRPVFYFSFDQYDVNIWRNEDRRRRDSRMT